MFLDASLGIGKIRLGGSKFQLQFMYLLVFLAYDTIETSNLLSLLGVGLLKLTQTLINRAQNFVSVHCLAI